MQMQNIFITRRHSEYADCFRELYPNSNIYLTDAFLSSNQEVIYPAELSIILCNEAHSDREPTSDWLNRITRQIRENSKQVILLLYFVYEPLNYEKDNMKVISMREMIDDDYNQKIIKQKLL